MDWKKILTLGALAGFAWFVYRKASAVHPVVRSDAYLDAAVNPIAQSALGLAPLQSPRHAQFGYRFWAGEPYTPAVALPVGASGLYEGAYAPQDLSPLEAR